MVSVSFCVWYFYRKDRSMNCMTVFECGSKRCAELSGPSHHVKFLPYTTDQCLAHSLSPSPPHWRESGLMLEASQ